jgi:endonuclease YncB( thermonuclease family)
MARGAVMLAVCVATAALAAPALADTVSGRVRVVDARTLVVEGTPVRLKWIVAPGLGDPGGVEAAIGLMRIVEEKIVTCHLDGPSPFGGGRLAGCETVGKDVGALLIEAGHARDCAGPSRRRYQAQEQRAVAAGATAMTDIPLPSECAVAPGRRR